MTTGILAQTAISCAIVAESTVGVLVLAQSMSMYGYNRAVASQGQAYHGSMAKGNSTVVVIVSHDWVSRVRRSSDTRRDGQRTGCLECFIEIYMCVERLQFARVVALRAIRLSVVVFVVVVNALLWFGLCECHYGCGSHAVTESLL